MSRRGWTKKLIAELDAGKPRPTVVPITELPKELQVGYSDGRDSAERAERWYTACRNALHAQPLVAAINPTSTHPYPEQPSDPEAVNCQCFDDKKDAPPQCELAEHIHSHHILPMVIEETLGMWDGVREFVVCPWRGCKYAGGIAEEFAAHLANRHMGAYRCLVPGAPMADCDKHATAEHLELEHGLLCLNGAEANIDQLVVYCWVCFRFVRGRKLIDEHMSSHLNEIVAIIERDDKCLGEGGALSEGRKKVFCPKCVHDTSLSATARLMGHESLAAHVSTHLVIHSSDTVLKCFFPTCPAAFAPLDLADHISDCHGIRMAQEGHSGVHGDLEKLILPEDDNIRLQMMLHILPICR